MKKCMLMFAAVTGVVSSVLGATKVSVSVADPRYGNNGNNFAITINGESATPDAIKEFEAGTEVTVTATSSTHYLRFGSDPVENIGKTATTTFTADGTSEVKLQLWCHPGWKYEEADGTATIYDGVWKLNVTKLDSNITVGTNGNNSALTGEGEGILDLSTPVTDAEGNPLAITTFVSHAFSASSADTRLPISMFIFPLTTEIIKGRMMCNHIINADSPLTNVVMVVPNCVEIGGRLFFSGDNNAGHKKLAALKVVAPALKSLNDGAFIGDWANCYTHKCVYKDTDLSTWNLDGLETVGKEAFKYINAQGVLKLPRVSEIKTGGLESATHIDGLEIGTAYTKEEGKSLTLGYQALRCLKMLKNLTFGSYASFNLTALTGTQKAGKLTELLSESLNADEHLDIIFLGNPPSQAFLDEELLLPTTIGIAKKTSIYVTYDAEEEWKKLLDNALETEEQYKPTVNRDTDILGVYRAENRKAWVARLPVKVSVSLADDRYGKNFEIKVNGQDVALNSVVKCSIGDTITATATSTETDGKTRYLRFGSDPVENVSTTATTTFIIENGDDVNLQLWCHTGWKYSDETKTISDEIWTLNVKKSGSNITVGTNGYDSAGKIINMFNSAFTERGEGILDLSTPVTDEEENPLQITTFANNCFAIHGSDSSLQKNPLTMMIFPATTTASGSWLFIDNLRVSNLTNVVMVLPNCKWLGSGLFKGAPNVETIKVVAPLVETLDGSKDQGIFMTDYTGYTNGVYGSKTDLGTWDVSSVINVKREAFKYTKMRGVLSLPKLLTGGYGAFECSDEMEGLVLGTAYKKKDNKTLTLEGQALRHLKKMKSITFGPYASYVFDADVANANLAANVDRIDLNFSGVPPSKEALDALLATIKASDAAKKVVIYGSRYLDWDKIKTDILTSEDGTETEEEKAAEILKETLAEDEDLMGVYVTEDGERKAWIVHRASEFDPKGTLLIIR